LIYQGSRNFNSKEIDGQVDVIKSLRQPGSTVKPFLYLQALEK
jgi:membrane carboxypeptidase/penicillin-binding protein PbpC